METESHVVHLLSEQVLIARKTCFNRCKEQRLTCFKQTNRFSEMY